MSQEKIIADALRLAADVAELVGDRAATREELVACSAAAQAAAAEWQTVVDTLRQELDEARREPPVGEYRVDIQSPVNVWLGPSDGGEQIAMASSPEWASRITTALNATVLDHVLSGAPLGPVAVFPAEWYVELSETAFTAPENVLALVTSWCLSTPDPTAQRPERAESDAEPAAADADGEPEPVAATGTAEVVVVSGPAASSAWPCPNQDGCRHPASSHAFAPGRSELPCQTSGCLCGHPAIAQTAAPAPVPETDLPDGAEACAHDPGRNLFEGV